MIVLKNVSLTQRLNHISCHVPQGKLVGIMGANGAGKSSLLKAIAGILPITSGEIWLENCNIHQQTALQRNSKISYLAQNPQVAWPLSVYDVLALGLPFAHKKADEIAKIHQIAKKFSIEPLLEKAFHQLSGGEQARVQLARCAIKQTPFLLADEPIAALDPYYQIAIMQQLKTLTPAQSCLIVIHHLPLAYRYCDEIILLKEGNLLASGATQTVLTQENIANAFGVKAHFDKNREHLLDIDLF